MCTCTLYIGFKSRVPTFSSAGHLLILPGTFPGHLRRKISHNLDPERLLATEGRAFWTEISNGGIPGAFKQVLSRLSFESF
jgi:hypothetical protein